MRVHPLLLLPVAVLSLLAGAGAAAGVPVPPACDDDADCPPVDDAISTRIIGGKDATFAPWQVSIGYAGSLIRQGGNSPDWQRQHMCGGALIAPDWVVTAAHCMEIDQKAQLIPPNLLVRFGSLRLDSPALQSIAIKRLIVHPDYQRNLVQNDIALVQLAKPVRLVAGSVAIIALPASQPRQGAPVTLTGWGTTSSTSYSIPAALQFVPLTIAANSQCLDAGFKSVTDTDLCAVGSGVSQCSGDSGGPLVWTADIDGRDTPTLIGVVSRSRAGCPVDKPALYTRIGSFVPWITTSMANNK